MSKWLPEVECEYDSQVMKVGFRKEREVLSARHFTYQLLITFYLILKYLRSVVTNE